MAEPEELERRLEDDLKQLDDGRFVDERFSTELYRALTNRIWRREGLDGHVSLSWNRAETLVNEQRERVGEPPLTLAQTGGEGEVSDLAGDELRGVGWTSTELNTGRHDEQHVSSPESPPPPGDGMRNAPDGEAGPRSRAEAHEEAEREAQRTIPTRGAGSE